MPVRVGCGHPIDDGGQRFLSRQCHAYFQKARIIEILPASLKVKWSISGPTCCMAPSRVTTPCKIAIASLPQTTTSRSIHSFIGDRSDTSVQKVVRRLSIPV